MEKRDYFNHPDAHKVMTIPQWCEFNNFSPATGKRILKSGDGPKLIRLSKRRVGVRYGDNAEWQDGRVRP
jgi:hypothetical protein